MAKTTSIRGLYGVRVELFDTRSDGRRDRKLDLFKIHDTSGNFALIQQWSMKRDEPLSQSLAVFCELGELSTQKLNEMIHGQLYGNCFWLWFPNWKDAVLDAKARENDSDIIVRNIVERP